MPKERGWIKLHRISLSNKFYFSDPFTRWQAWVDLLLIANHTEGWVRCRGVRQIVLRGQIGLSSTELAKRWRWSRGKVIRYLDELTDDHQIVLQKSNITTLISIVNYNKYQLDDTADDTANSTANSTTNRTTDSPQTVQQTFVTTMSINELQPPKNDKNDKNDKELNKYIPKEGQPPPPPPNSFFPKYTNYNGLPDVYFEMFYKLIRSTKQIEVSKDDVTALWDVFKEQNLTGEKEYKDERDFYRHFINWGNKQSFRKKPVPKDRAKTLKEAVGVEFINDFVDVKMSDGSIQKLTRNQSDLARHGQSNPKSITKIHG